MLQVYDQISVSMLLATEMRTNLFLIVVLPAMSQQDQYVTG